MKEPEQFIVPCLGALALISIVLLGTAFHSLAYLILLGLLGVGAIGTYFMPAAVQAEVRILIAALGLLVLIFMFSSLGFWLALLSFGTMGALQIRHRGILRMPPTHTLEWLRTLQAQRGEGGGKAALSATDTGDEAAAPAQPAESAPTETSGSGIVGKAGIGGLGASALGIVILLTAVMPWFGLSIEAESRSWSAWELVQEVRAEDNDSSIEPFRQKACPIGPSATAMIPPTIIVR